MSKTPIALLLLTACLSACSSADKKDPLLVEAAQYHQQATEVQEEVEPKIDRIDSLKTAILTQKLPDASARTATLDSLKTAFKDWEDNLVEVPGMPHAHRHEHGEHAHHHHHDTTLKDLPADQMRDLQRETLANIRQIQTRLTEVSRVDHP